MTDNRSMFMYEGEFGGGMAIVAIPINNTAPHQFSFYSPMTDMLHITSKDANDGFLLVNQYEEDGSNKKITVVKDGKNGKKETSKVDAFRQEKIKRPMELEISNRVYIKQLLEAITINFNEEALDKMFEIADNIKKHRNNDLVNPSIIQAEDVPLVANTPSLITVSK